MGSQQFSIFPERTPHSEVFLKERATDFFPVPFPDQEQQQFPAWNGLLRGLCSTGTREANTHAPKTAKRDTQRLPEPGKAGGSSRAISAGAG